MIRLGRIEMVGDLLDNGVPRAIVFVHHSSATGEILAEVLTGDARTSTVRQVDADDEEALEDLASFLCQILAEDGGGIEKMGELFDLLKR